MSTFQRCLWAVSVVMWTLAWTFMMAGFFLPRDLPFEDLGLFLGLGGAVAMTWGYIDHATRRERLELERLAEIMASAMVDERHLRGTSVSSPFRVKSDGKTS